MSSLQIKQGLSEFGYTDHYAILGLPVDAPNNEIRKRYLKIARSLHPDSCPPGTDKVLASKVLSRLVNPSYQSLSQEKERSEYALLLKLVGQRANLELDLERLKYPQAQKLANERDFEKVYAELITALSQNQYDNLEQLVTQIERLSELNLVFLLRRENPQYRVMAQGSPNPVSITPRPVTQSGATAATVPVSPQFSAANTGNTTASASSAADDLVQKYIRRAEDLMSKNRFPEAIRELKDAIKIDPTNSRCQTLMGRVYLQQNQLTMAKVHINQALKLDPESVEAMKASAELQRRERQAGKTTQPSGKPAEQRKGLFGLFGGKK